MNLIEIPKFKTSRIESADEYGGQYIKTTAIKGVISMPSEFDFYMKKFKRVYRIELSHSTKRWVLTFDDGTWGWDQRGWYVKTLCAAIGHRPHMNFLSAVEKASELFPDELAFFCPEFMEYESNNPEFDAWWKQFESI